MNRCFFDYVPTGHRLFPGLEPAHDNDLQELLKAASRFQSRIFGA